MCVRAAFAPDAELAWQLQLSLHCSAEPRVLAVTCAGRLDLCTADSRAIEIVWVLVSGRIAMGGARERSL